VWHVIKLLQWKIGWINLSRMSTLCTGELIVAKCLEIQKHLKVQWDIDDADEVQEITAAKTPMKKYDKWI
jgi:hypothetical protein